MKLASFREEEEIVGGRDETPPLFRPSDITSVGGKNSQTLERTTREAGSSRESQFY